MERQKRGQVYEHNHVVDEGGFLFFRRKSSNNLGNTFRRAYFLGSNGGHIHPKLNGEICHSLHVPVGESKRNGGGIAYDSMTRLRRVSGGLRKQRQNTRG